MVKRIDTRDALLTVYWFMYPRHYPWMRQQLARGLWKPSLWILKPLPCSSAR